MYPNIIATILLLILPFAHHKILARNDSNEESVKISSYLGKSGLSGYFAGIVLIWVTPLGAILVPLIILGISFISPFGRMEWKEYAQPRRQIVAIGFVMILCTGFIPATEPAKPSEWGAPLPLESTESSLYPAGNEYVWLLNSGGEIWSVSDGGDWSIVISYKINTPHQFGAFGQTGATLLIADVFSLEDNKLASALEVINQQLPGPPIEKNEIALIDVPGTNNHDYFYDSGEDRVNVNLQYRIWTLNSLVLGSTSSGTPIAEVLLVATNSWDGSIDMLVVIRQRGNPDLDINRFAENTVSVWLNTIHG